MRSPIKRSALDLADFRAADGVPDRGADPVKKVIKFGVSHTEARSARVSPAAELLRNAYRVNGRASAN